MKLKDKISEKFKFLKDKISEILKFATIRESVDDTIRRMGESGARGWLVIIFAAIATAIYVFWLFEGGQLNSTYIPGLIVTILLLFFAVAMMRKAEGKDSCVVRKYIWLCEVIFSIVLLAIRCIVFIFGIVFHLTKVKTIKCHQGEFVLSILYTLPVALVVFFLTRPITTFIVEHCEHITSKGYTWMFLVCFLTGLAYRMFLWLSFLQLRDGEAAKLKLIDFYRNFKGDVDQMRYEMLTFVSFFIFAFLFKTLITYTAGKAEYTSEVFNFTAAILIWISIKEKIYASSQEDANA